MATTTRTTTGHRAWPSELDPQRPITLDAAREHVRRRALHDDPPGPVGLELEGHLVDLDHVTARLPWGRLRDVVRRLPDLPGGSRVTVEPGGQVELSGPPARDVVAAVAALRRDEVLLRAALAEDRLGWALLGADPVRPARRVSPGGRYVAMEAHFASTGQRDAGLAMMTSTCALQVNLQAGRVHEHATRVQQVHRLGPVLVALSAASAWLAGDRTGWRSSRQWVWGRLDQTRCGPLRGTPDPAGEWASYALGAPVMLVHHRPGGAEQPVRSTVAFGRWVTGEVRLDGRLPTPADLDYHLTTLFPPARLRGWVELRCLDAPPARWWAGLAALVATLVDDPVAADAAAEAAEPVALRWTSAARDGLADAAIARAARRCTEVAAAAVPPALRPDVEAWAELVQAGRVPGDDLDDRAGRVGPATVLEEESRA